jgi:pilus assembly protein FimV
MILRVPDTEEVERVGRSEANAEAQRHNAEWKSGLDESPRLRLVPPPEPGEVTEPAPRTATDAGSGVPAAGTAEMQGRIDELETELSDSRRLIELRDRELQALQEQLASRAEGIPETPAIDAAPVVEETGAEPVVPDEGIVDETLDAGVEEPIEAVGGEEVVQPEPPAPGPDVVVTTSPPEESSFIAQLFSSVWLYVSLAIVLLLGWLIVRRRTAVEGAADSWDRLDTGVEDFTEEATTSLGAPPAHEDQAFVVEETPPADDTDAVDDSPYADVEPDAEGDVAADEEEEPELPFERTISAESAVNLDQADPIAEADFHMAYGLYDQAADLLTNALESDPEKKDLRLKLLEVYFIWENQGGFLKEAQILQGSVDEAADPDWNKVLIMGKQICPAEELFAAAPSAPGEAEDMDLAFGEEADLGEDAEIDITFGAAEESIDLLFEDEDDGGMIDFDLTGEELTGASDSPTEETPTVEAASAGGSAMETPTMENPEVSRTMETPTMENPEVPTTMETPTIEAAAGDWAADEADSESEEPVEQTAEIDLDDLGLDLAGIDAGHEEDLDAEESASQLDLEVPDFGLEASALDETGLKQQISGEEAGVGSDSIGEKDVEDQAVQDLLDVEPTAQMQNVDLESLSGDTVEQPSVGDTAEQPAVETDTVSFDTESLTEDSASLATAVDLDIGEDIALEGEPTGALDTLAGAVVEGATMTEVGTKLDLARAYIDMGDPDGARSILNEVLEEAADSQRQEAQKLLDDLGD